MEYNFIQPISKNISDRKYIINEGDESVEQVFQDISDSISYVEKDSSYWSNVFLKEMKEGRFIPAGRILAGARPNLYKIKNLLNCYTIEILDSIDGITQAIQDYMRILSMGGGVGFNISSLRPDGAPVNSGGETSGPLSFLEIFNQASKTISLGGGRRGASIAILNIDHPDVESFITHKQGENNNALTQFNISVGITDDFIKAAENGEDWNLQFNGEVYKTVKADYLYNLLMENAYWHNEPGVFNLDHVNNNNNGWYMYNIYQPNPCGEQPLPPYGACDLGALNLVNFVQNPFTDDAYFDFDLFEKSISIGIRFLDNVLDVTAYPLKKIEEQVLSERRVGLGFTGLGNAFSMLKMAYNSEGAFELADKIGETLRDTSYETSSDLAKEKGVFPNYDNKILKSNFIKKMPNKLQKRIKKNGLRNISTNTVAPTGTTSLSIGQNCSSGIEPSFSVQYERTIRTDVGEETKKETVYDYAWLKYLEFLGYPREEVKRPSWFSIAYDLKPEDHVKMQGVFQKYIDASISKTINLPKETTFEEYKDVFMMAYRYGLKGTTTFYEGGSIPGILSSSSSSDDSEELDENGRPLTIKRVNAPKRPKDLECDIHQLTVNKEKHLALVGRLKDGSIYEMFLTPNPEKEIDVGSYKHGINRKVKKGHYQLIIPNGEEKCIVDNIGKVFNETYGSLSRFISMGLRHGVDLEFIVEQLQKDTSFASFEKAVARILKKYIKDGEKIKSSQSCPICGSTDLIYESGCRKCTSCGWSACD